MRKSIGLLFIGLFAGILIGYLIFSTTDLGLFKPGGPSQPPVIGKKLPGAALVNFEGETVNLRDYKGKPLVINFWATWCPPCKKEMPLLQRFSLENRDKVTVVGIDVLEPAAAVRGFVAGNDISFPILLDLEGHVQDNYRILGLPTTLFVDKDGVLQAQHIGALTEELLAQYTSLIGLPE